MATATAESGGAPAMDTDGVKRPPSLTISVPDPNARSFPNVTADDDTNASAAAPKKNPFAGLKIKRRKRRRDQNEERSFKSEYRTEEMIGEGAFSKVKRAIELKTEKEFAVKIVCWTDRYTKEDMEHEMSVLRLCCMSDHPHVVSFIEHFEGPYMVHFVFELMKGGPLFDHVQNRGHLAEHEAAFVVENIANGLAFVHSIGVAHRDLKPENIMCKLKNELLPVKIGDFGLSTLANAYDDDDEYGGGGYGGDDGSPGRAGKGNRDDDDGDDDGGDSDELDFDSSPSYSGLHSPVGTAEYLAPEVIETMYDPMVGYNQLCDVWSLGVVTYVLLCGEPPFRVDCGNPSCTWNDGGACEMCTDLLMDEIQDGEVWFDSEVWDRVSHLAKDLIMAMLTDVTERFTAEDVLDHPWVAGTTPKTPLYSPAVLLKRDQSMNQISRLLDTKRKRLDNRIVRSFSDNRISMLMLQGLRSPPSSAGLAAAGNVDPVTAERNRFILINASPGKSALSLRRRLQNQRRSVSYNEGLAGLAGNARVDLAQPPQASSAPSPDVESNGLPSPDFDAMAVANGRPSVARQLLPDVASTGAMEAATGSPLGLIFPSTHSHSMDDSPAAAALSPNSAGAFPALPVRQDTGSSDGFSSASGGDVGGGDVGGGGGEAST